MKLWISILLSLALTGASHAQTHIYETNEDYARSMEHRAIAFEAYQAQDLPKALEYMKLALSSRPINPLLLRFVAFLEAETGDPDKAFIAAQKYAALGLVPGDRIQNKLREKLSAEQWMILETAFSQNKKPIGNNKLLAELPADILLVEGVTLDSVGNLYISTVVSGNIHRIDPTSGKVSLFYEGHPDGISSFFGITYHEERGSLFVTYGLVDQSPIITGNTLTTGVAEIDIQSGNLKQIWDLGESSAGHQIADLTVAPDGAVYLSDAKANTVYQIGDDTLTLVHHLEHAGNLQGIVAISNSELLVADYLRGLWKLDIAEKTTKLLEFPNSTSPLGIDGLTLHKDKLIAIQNGLIPHRIVSLGLDRTAEQIVSVDVLVKSHTPNMEPTLGTSAKDGLIYVAGSQWPKFGEKGRLHEGMTHSKTPIHLIPNQ